MKTLEQLHDEQDKLPKIHAQVEQELKKIPGVIAVGIGFKQTQGEKTDTISFIVYVQEKKDLNDLTPEQIIPKEIQGVKTDVVKVSSASTATTNLPDKSKHRPIKGGIQIGNGIKDSTGLYHFGTLGCFATLNSDNSVVGLSNQHVMFAAGGHGESGGTHNGSKMGQPEYYESCCCDCDLIGTIINGVRDGVIDGAICTLNSDVDKVNEIEEIGVVAGAAPSVNVGGIDTPVRVGDPVKKRGRTTGLMTGTVESINFPITIDGTLFTGQIHVTPDDPTKRFFDHGDSGSVLVNSTNQVAGLLAFFPNATGTTDPDGTGVANKIQEVMTRLSISIPTGAFPASGGSGVGTIRRTSFNRPFNPVTEESPAKIIHEFERRLNNSPQGKLMLDLYYKHRIEIRDMINSYRPATISWHRNQGPAFLACIVKSIKNPGLKIEKQINGISMETLMNSMKSIFLTHGSISLMDDINSYSAMLMKFVLSSDSAENAIENITIFN